MGVIWKGEGTVAGVLQPSAPLKRPAASTEVKA
jgi:hypothetical protein